VESAIREMRAGEVLVGETLVQYGCREDATILLYLIHIVAIQEGAIAKCKGIGFSNCYRSWSTRACGTETLVPAVIGVGFLEQVVSEVSEVLYPCRCSHLAWIANLGELELPCT
jgi:hypothetical protein